jgi:hypothetical protein
MGLRKPPSPDSGSYAVQRNFNPNPKNFQILKVEQFGSFLLAEIRYPDCINVEGRKILLFFGMSPAMLERATEIDPHFQSRGGCLIARFHPAKGGWDLGCEIAENLAKKYRY